MSRTRTGMYMSNRSAKFVSALFATILAGASCAAVAENDTRTAVAESDAKVAEKDAKASDNCLAAPKGAAPAGGHWYYRFDRASKRQCWYIGEEKERSTRAAPSESSPPPAAAANSAPPQPGVSARKSIANARAEFTAPTPAAAPNAGVNVAPRKSRAVTDDGPRAIAPDASPPTAAVTPRWPDSSVVSSPNELKLAAANLPENAPAEAETAPQQNIVPVTPAAANLPPPKPSGSMQMLLLVMVGALALASLIGSAVFRLGRRRSPARQTKDGRRAIWRTVDTDRRRSPPLSPDEEVAVRRHAAPRVRADAAPRRRADAAYDPRARDDAERRLAEMLQRLARSAATQ
jgi:hypothetical protein